jgi:hypothetical protein
MSVALSILCHYEPILDDASLRLTLDLKPA